MYYSNSYVYPDYLCHYGVLGMKWGQHLFGKVSTAAANHKAKKAAIKSEQKNLISSYKAKDPASHMANKAAKAYYKSIRSDSKYYASKAKSKSERLQASLTDEQVKSGRYRVANARNIRRKVLSTSLAALTGAGTAAMAVSTGGLAAAVVLGAGSASITGVATNLISGGHYYAKEAKAYGSNRAKTQAKVNVAAGANSSSDDDEDND